MAENQTKMFWKYLNARIAIYGISVQTKIFIEENSDLNIVGFLDSYKKEGIIYGKPILDLDELLKRDIDVIIIIARVNSTEMIFRKISDFCLKNHIQVLNSKGKEIKHEDYKDQFEEVNNISLEIMLREIDSHEVVSFDIFDTLLMRKVLFPNDVFYLMQKREGLNDSFPENRISVEKKMMSEGIIAPSIFEIYKRLIDEYPEAGYDEQKLINLEYELDRNLILCRNDITYAFIYARMKKKRIFLISDMYYSKGQIQQILLDNDIVGYEDIFISSEYGINKEEGLFVKLLEKLDSKKVLHVGDCYEADILAAEQCQIDTFWIKSAVSVMNSSRYRHLLKYTNSLEQRVMLGLFVARIFNSPFALYHTLGKGIIDNSRDITYLFAAPIITEYILWLCSQVDNKKCQVIFPSRDGFILKVLYENLKSNKKLFKKLPNSVYLVTSRAVCIGASLFDEDDINYAAVFPYEGTPEHLLIERFFLGKGEIEQFDGRFKSHTSVKKYLKIVGAKTSALLATSLAVGAYEAGCDERFCKKLGKIGLHVGNAFQIIDDILDYTGDEARVGKTLGNDLKQGYYTLPLIYALRKNDSVLNRLLAADVYDDETIKRIIVRVNELGGVRQAQLLAEKYTIKSLKEISSLPTCQSRDDLEWITKRLLVREH